MNEIDHLLLTILEKYNAKWSIGPQGDTQNSPMDFKHLPELLSEFPFLTRDSGYHFFLSNYDTLLNERVRPHSKSERTSIAHIEINGYSHFWFDVRENGYPLVDEEGFVEIAVLSRPFQSGSVNRSVVFFQFAIPTTIDLPLGVYCSHFFSPECEGPSPRRLFCSSFLDLLRILATDSEAIGLELE